MPIRLTDRQKRTTVDSAWIAEKGRQLLETLACPDDELSLLLVEEDEMARLNRQFRGVKGPTDVLAFPMREGEENGLHTHLLGDVVLCPQQVAGGPGPLSDEVLRLLIHGVLHLHGFHHETQEEARRMGREEKRLWQALEGEAGP